jgi:hypothetical protein
MKDSEFIELLNLYIDHEISAADAARLEAEVQSNPARRHIYQEYCRMQKACKVLAQDFQTETANVADKKVVPFQTLATARSARGSSFYTIGAFAAAAACVAIIFVGRNRQQAAAEAGQAQSVAASVAPAAAPQAVASDVKSTPISIDTPAARAGALASKSLRRAEPPQATFVANDALFLTPNNSADTVATAQQANDRFAWLTTNLGMVPIEQQLQLEQLRFQSAPTTLRPEGSRALGSRSMPKSQEPATEMSAFQLRLGR